MGWEKLFSFQCLFDIWRQSCYFTVVIHSKTKNWSLRNCKLLFHLHYVHYVSSTLRTLIAFLSFIFGTRQFSSKTLRCASWPVFGRIRTFLARADLTFLTDKKCCSINFANFFFKMVQSVRVWLHTRFIRKSIKCFKSLTLKIRRLFFLTGLKDIGPGSGSETT